MFRASPDVGMLRSLKIRKKRDMFTYHLLTCKVVLCSFQSCEQPPAHGPGAYVRILLNPSMEWRVGMVFFEASRRILSMIGTYPQPLSVLAPHQLHSRAYHRQKTHQQNRKYCFGVLKAAVHWSRDYILFQTPRCLFPRRDKKSRMAPPYLSQPQDPQN